LVVYGRQKILKRFLSKSLWIATAAIVLAGVVPSFADVMSQDDPLHAFCYGSSSCADNGTITPTTSTSPQFGFYITPGPNTGDFLVDILIPTNEVATPNSTSFSITGTQGGATDTSSVSGTASLISTKAWTTGHLTDYLSLTKFNGAPPNPIGAWLPSTQAFDPGASGYYVFQADLGTNELQNGNKELLGPLLSLDELLPEGTLIVGFLGTPQGFITTSQDSALLIDSPVPVPEPDTVAIFGVALMMLAAGYHCKRT
jgi:hypothetical protein